MNRPAVTQAQAQRLVKSMEGMGKTVFALRAHPDGSVDLLLTEPASPPEVVTGDDGGWEAHEKRHGHG